MTIATDTATNARANARQWIALATLTLPCVVYAMDLTVLNLALPSIGADLQPTGLQLLWIVDIYGFVLAGCLITMGSLGDRIGRRRLLMIGAAAFAAASFLAAFSSNSSTLIVARSLLGVAGATLAPSTLSLIRQIFLAGDERALAVGIWTASFSVGGALGPLIGGLVLQHYAWNAIFLMAVPAMVAVLIAGPTLLPEFVDTKASRLDFASALQSIGAVLLVILGFKQVTAAGWHWSAAATISIGLGIGVAFVRRQQRLRDPLIDIRLLRSSAFAVPLLAYGVGCFVAFGISLFVAQYLQSVLGLSPFAAGLWSLPSALGFVVGSVATPRIMRDLTPATTIAAGLTIAATGLGAVALPEITAGAASVALALFAVSTGFATAFVPAVNSMLAAVPRQRAGEASAISETGSELGGALGIAVLGSIGNACYRVTLSQTLPPELAKHDVQTASETLAGAFNVAARLHGDQRILLVDAAQAAFDHSMRVAAGLSASIVLGLAVVVVVVMRTHAQNAHESD
jgi:DHA2 family multidrug resistance protein-like MFS transporter